MAGTADDMLIVKSEEAMSSFMSIVSTTSRDLALAALTAADWDLERALNHHFGLPTGGNATGAASSGAAPKVAKKKKTTTKKGKGVKRKAASAPAAAAAADDDDDDGVEVVVPLGDDDDDDDVDFADAAGDDASDDVEMVDAAPPAAAAAASSSSATAATPAPRKTASRPAATPAAAPQVPAPAAPVRTAAPPKARVQYVLGQLAPQQARGAYRGAGTTNLRDGEAEDQWSGDGDESFAAPAPSTEDGDLVHTATTLAELPDYEVVKRTTGDFTMLRSGLLPAWGVWRGYFETRGNAKKTGPVELRRVHQTQPRSTAPGAVSVIEAREAQCAFAYGERSVAQYGGIQHEVILSAPRLEQKVNDSTISQEVHRMVKNKSSDMQMLGRWPSLKQDTVRKWDQAVAALERLLQPLAGKNLLLARTVDPQAAYRYNRQCSCIPCATKCANRYKKNAKKGSARDGIDRALATLRAADAKLDGRTLLSQTLPAPQQPENDVLQTLSVPTSAPSMDLASAQPIIWLLRELGNMVAVHAMVHELPAGAAVPGVRWPATGDYSSQLMPTNSVRRWCAVLLFFFRPQCSPGSLVSYTKPSEERRFKEEEIAGLRRDAEACAAELREMKGPKDAPDDDELEAAADDEEEGGPHAPPKGASEEQVLRLRRKRALERRAARRTHLEGKLKVAQASIKNAESALKEKETEWAALEQRRASSLAATERPASLRIADIVPPNEYTDPGHIIDSRVRRALMEKSKRAFGDWSDAAPMRDSMSDGPMSSYTIAGSFGNLPMRSFMRLLLTDPTAYKDDELLETPAGLKVQLFKYQRRNITFMARQEEHPSSVEGENAFVRYRDLLGLERQFGMVDGESGSVPGPRLSRNRGGFLCDEMGLGKTISVIALLLARPAPAEWLEAPSTMKYSYTTSQRVKGAEPIVTRHEGACKRVRASLIIVPVSVLGQWQQELARRIDAEHALTVGLYYGATKARTLRELPMLDVVLTTPGIMRQAMDLSRFEFWRCVLDESHCVKGSGVHHGVFTNSRALQRWCVTGTPVCTAYQDAIGQLQWLGNTKAATLATSNQSPALPLVRLMRALTVRHTKTGLGCVGEPLPLSMAPPEPRSVTVEVELSTAEREFHDKLLEHGCADYARRLRMMSNHYIGAMSLLLRGRRACSWVSQALMTQYDELMANGGAAAVLAAQGDAAAAAAAAAGAAPAPPVATVAPFNDGSNECAICLDELEDPVMTACRHQYCHGCISAVLLNSGRASVPCPMCRQPVTEDQLKVVQQPKKKGKDGDDDDDGGDGDDDDGGPAKKKAKKGKGKGKGKEAAVDGDIVEEDAPIPNTAEHPSSKVKAAMKELTKIFREDGTAKVVIFTQFSEAYDAMGAAMTRAGIKYSEIRGNMTGNKRSAMLQHFTENVDVRVFLLSMRSGAVGLTLIAANHVFLLDACLNPGLELQAINRAHRVGQRRVVTTHRFVATNSVESRVVALQQQRSSSTHNLDMNTSKASLKLKRADFDFLFNYTPPENKWGVHAGGGGRGRRRRAYYGDEEDCAIM